MNNKNRSINRTRKLVTIGTLGGISIFLGVTRLGFIPLGAFNLTIMHIPVIIGALLEGPIVGIATGLIFGLFSMYQNFVAPTSLSSFVFLNPIVAVIPRVLIGVVSYYVYKLLKNLLKNKSISIGVAAVLGSLTNSIGVLGLIYILYLEPYAAAINKSTDLVGSILIGAFLTNGLAEAVFSALIAIPLVTVLTKIRRN